MACAGARTAHLGGAGEKQLMVGDAREIGFGDHRRMCGLQHSLVVGFGWLSLGWGISQTTFAINMPMAAPGVSGHHPFTVMRRCQPPLPQSVFPSSSEAMGWLAASTTAVWSATETLQTVV